MRLVGLIIVHAPVLTSTKVAGTMVNQNQELSRRWQFVNSDAQSHKLFQAEKERLQALDATLQSLGIVTHPVVAESASWWSLSPWLRTPSPPEVNFGQYEEAVRPIIDQLYTTLQTTGRRRGDKVFLGSVDEFLGRLSSRDEAKPVGASRSGFRPAVRDQLMTEPSNGAGGHPPVLNPIVSTSEGAAPHGRLPDRVARWLPH